MTSPVELPDPEAGPVVLDASALGAVVFSEKGSDEVVPYLTNALISAVNLSEIAAKAMYRGGHPEVVTLMLSRLPLEVVPFDAAQAHLAATIYPLTHGKNISFADRACLSLGLARKVPILTADSKWAELSLPVDVRLFR